MKRIVILIIGIMLISLIAYYLTNSDNMNISFNSSNKEQIMKLKNKNELFGKIKKQQNNRRLFKDIPKVKHTISLEKHDIFSPSMLATNIFGNVAFYDYEYHRIYTYTKESKRFNTFGGGLGGGPREFRNPTDLKIDDQQNIWVSDVKQSRFSKWSWNGKLLASYSTEDSFMPFRIVVYDNTIISLSNKILDSGIFFKYNLKNDEIVHSFEKINLYTTFSNFIIAGHLKSMNNSFYWGLTNYGIIKKYDTNGRILFKRYLIDNGEQIKPEIEKVKIKQIKNAVGYKVSDKSKIAVVDLAGANGNLYILFSGTPYYSAEYIDIYNAENGDYKYSYHLNYPATDIDISNKHMWLLQIKDRKNYLSYYNL